MPPNWSWDHMSNVFITYAVCPLLMLMLERFQYSFVWKTIFFVGGKAGNFMLKIPNEHPHPFSIVRSLFCVSALCTEVFSRHSPNTPPLCHIHGHSSFCISGLSPEVFSRHSPNTPPLCHISTATVHSNKQ